MTSPIHEQTYVYGTQQNQSWIILGRDRHLALTTEFTNDPHVDRVETRQYDEFIFDFPRVLLGADGQTLFYRTPEGIRIAVAMRTSGFLGVDHVKLLNTSFLVIKAPHGYLTLSLIVHDHPLPEMGESSP